MQTPEEDHSPANPPATGTGRDLAAAVMSVVPGLGHFYKGQKLIGAVAMAAAIALGVFVAGTVVATVGVALVLVPAYIIGVGLHAYWAEDLALEKFAATPEADRPRRVPEIPQGK